MPKAKTGEFHSKDKRKLPIFIHSELDDYGLSPVEFRTYARIARRAGGDSKLTESVPNMAEAFGVADATVRRALQVLCLCGLVSKRERPGWTPEYFLNDQDKWLDKSGLKAVRELVLHPKKGGGDTLITTDRGTPDHQTQGGVVTTDRGPYSPEIDEGTPEKVLPEGTPVITTHAQDKPLQPDSDDEHDAKAPKYSIEEMEQPPSSVMTAIRSEIVDKYPDIPFEKFYVKWWRKNFRMGGVGRKQWEKATVRQYTVSIDGYFETVSEGGLNGNGATNGKQQSSFETGSERNFRFIQESLARSPSSCGEDNNQESPLLLTAGAKSR